MPIQPTSHASEPPGRRFMSAFPAAQETQNPISKKSGKILHIDFGDCFEASMNREKFPEKVINVAAFQVSQFLFIKFGVCQPAVPPQEQPNDDDHDDGGIDSIDTS
ncbi:hypothetical protein ACLB2K_069016 [Fragaria x ananassa]